MAKISLIAAIGKNNELGKDNNLIWHLKGDLKFFKETTMNHKIIMGYNTFKSLPRLLPGREHIVLTHRDLKLEGVTIFNSFEDLINYLNGIGEKVYVIGGASIYKQFIDIADELVLTRIDAQLAEADVYFPEFNREEYIGNLVAEQEENYIRYKHIEYLRKPKYLSSCDEYYRVMGVCETRTKTWSDLDAFSYSPKVKKLGTKEE